MCTIKFVGLLAWPLRALRLVTWHVFFSRTEQLCLEMNPHGGTLHCGKSIGHVRYINILTWLRGFQVKPLYLVSEEVGEPSRDNFLPIRFFAQHASGGPRKFSKSESSGSIFWFPVVCVQRIELESIPLVWCEDILSWGVEILKVSLS